MRCIKNKFCIYLVEGATYLIFVILLRTRKPGFTESCGVLGVKVCENEKEYIAEAVVEVFT